MRGINKNRKIIYFNGKPTAKSIILKLQQDHSDLISGSLEFFPIPVKLDKDWPLEVAKQRFLVRLLQVTKAAKLI